MYRCKHCTYQDYVRLIKTSDLFLSNLIENGFDQEELDNYLEFISDYNDDISCEIKSKLSRTGLDKYNVEKVIKSQLEILYQEVLVDIKEHQ